MRARTSKPPVRKTYTAAAVDHFAASGLGVAEMRKLGVVEYGPSQCPEVSWVRYRTLAIPYHDLRGKPLGFTRYRVLTDDEQEPKYTQPKGSGIHLYFPPVLPGGWLSVVNAPGTRVLITEGEKKATAACLLGFPTVALAGVDCWGKGGALLSDWVGLAGVSEFVILFDSDAAENRHSQETAERLAALLRQRGARVLIAFVPALEGCGKVGLDDFIQQDPSTAKVRVEALLATAVRHVLPELALNDEYAVVPHGAKTLVIHEDRLPDGSIKVKFYRPQELVPLFANKFVLVPTGKFSTDEKGRKRQLFARKPMFQAWMESPGRREYKRVVFKPEGCAPDEYNMWQGFSVEPREGDCTVFLEFLKHCICGGDEEHFDYLLKYLATMFQRPGTVARVAVALRGRQGTGKSSLADIIGSLMPAHYVTVVSTEQLVGNFTGHLDGAVFVFADEAVFPGDKRSEGILKTFITGGLRPSHRKFIELEYIPNCAHLILATNHDWAVPADADDRRWFLVDVSNEHADDRAYFKRLHEAMNEEGKAALLYYLLNYPADDFFELKPPKTRGLLEQKLRSLSAPERFWLDCLAAGGIVVDGEWPQEIPTAAVQAKWETVRVMLGDRRSAATELGMNLAQMVPGLVNRRKSVNSRQVPHYVFPALPYCQAAFARRFGDRITWSDIAAVLGISDAADTGRSQPSPPSRPFSEIKKKKKKVNLPAKVTAPPGQLGRLPADADIDTSRKKEKF